jgi:hypothetical protein
MYKALIFPASLISALLRDQSILFYQQTIQKKQTKTAQQLLHDANPSSSSYLTSNYWFIKLRNK